MCSLYLSRATGKLPQLISLYRDDLQTRQDAANGRLTNFAPNRIFADAELLHNLSKVPELLDPDDAEKVGSRHREVPTEVVVQLMARFFHLSIKDIRYLSGQIQYRLAMLRLDG